MSIIVKPHRELQAKIDSTGDHSISLAIDEFREYKEGSHNPSEIPTPTRKEQEDFQGVHSTFGRDRLFLSPIKCKTLDIHHVHIFQGGCDWGNDDSFIVQWECTSNCYLVYSYFLSSKQNHIFCVLDFILDGAHDIYEHPELPQIHAWCDWALDFKNQFEDIL